MNRSMFEARAVASDCEATFTLRTVGLNAREMAHAFDQAANDVSARLWAEAERS